MDYLNTETVQAAIGAYVNFTESSTPVGNAFGSTGDDDREIGTVEALKSLIAKGVKLVMYFGDADYNCNWLGGQVVAEHVNATGYNNEAGFVNISSSDDVVHGQVRQAGSFAFIRIYESGHEVPFYQPLVALEVLNRTIHGLDVATGQTAVNATYRTTGPKTSTYQEGNATVQMDVVPVDDVYNTTTAQPQNGTTASPPKRRLKRAFETVKGRGWLVGDDK